MKSYLLGREFFETVAGRHMGREPIGRRSLPVIAAKWQEMVKRSLPSLLEPGVWTGMA
jgi:hypothetical protein